MYKIEINASTVFDLRQKVTRLYDDMNNDFMGRHGSSSDQLDLPQMTEKISSTPVFNPLALGNNMVAAPPIAPAPVPTVSNAAAAGKVDVRGIPHDVRIHSAEGSVNKDGSWRYRRAIDKALIAQVEAELKGTVAPVAPVTLPSAPAPLAPPLPAQTFEAPVPTFTAPPPFQQPVAVPAPVAAPVQPVYESPIAAQIPTLPTGKPMHSLATFKNNLPDVLAQFIAEKKIDQAYIDSLVVHFAKSNPQIKSIWNVLGNEKQCMELFDVFVKSGFITRIEG